MRETSRWMRRALTRKGASILLLDKLGNSEAPLMAAAYLIRYENVSVKATIQVIKPVIQISWTTEQIRHLLEFEALVREGARLSVGKPKLAT